MAIDFSNLKGKAEKGSFDRFKPVNGINRFRMIGSILPMYSYWVQLADDTGKVPVECLSFNREEERFDNKEIDNVRRNEPELKCSWSYKGLVLDRSDGKIKVFDHKKKLLESIIKMAGKLGDPTNMDTGWDIIFERKKTGPAAFNIEYSLEFGELDNTPLTEEEKALVAETEDITTFFPRPTPEDQNKFLKEKVYTTLEEVPEELNDDIPQ